jgi:hypothetical protein
VEGFAQDGYCSNTMRSLTDTEVIKHVGDVGDFRAWWEEILAQVELVADDRFEFIREAADIDREFSNRPSTVTECDSLLGFPAPAPNTPREMWRKPPLPPSRSIRGRRILV